MGFFDKAVDAFGTKTGKAIGNKLYGSNADDYRIGTNRGGENENDLALQEKVVKHGRNQKLLDDVLNLDLNPTDKDGIIKGLTTLSSYIDLWSKNEDSEENIEAAVSKFDTGLALLSAIDPSNPMNAYFLQKKEERIAKKKKKKKNEFILMMVGIGIMVSLFIVVGIVLWLDLI